MDKLLMQKRFYLCKIIGGVEPDLFGPFGTEQSQELGLLNEVRTDPELGPEGEDCILWLEINEQGVPSMGAYSKGYMDEIRRLAGHEVDEGDKTE